jgi:hypothetical protein
MVIDDGVPVDEATLSANPRSYPNQHLDHMVHWLVWSGRFGGSHPAALGRGCVKTCFLMEPGVNLSLT